MPPVAGPRRGGPVLLASSAGGHFTELQIIARQRGIRRDEQHWVVPSTAQTRSALAGHPSVTWVPQVGAHEFSKAVQQLGAALRLHRALRPRMVLSAGAAQAVPHLLAAGALHTPVQYVESVARVDGPSLTGRLVAQLPTAQRYAPVPGWGRRWQTAPNVFSLFRAVPGDRREIRHAVVALGTERFPFHRALAEARAALPSAAEVIWQTGATTYALRGSELPHWIPSDELAEAMAGADVVITHAGAGSILTALGVGHVPVVLPRSGALGEHVDEHQIRMAHGLAERGLVVLVRPGEALCPEHLERAAGTRVVVATSAALPVAEPVGH